MNEFRLNLAENKWVIIAPERGKRPKKTEEPDNSAPLPEHDENCPFCAGNEKLLGDIIYETKIGSSWQTRVIENKYPALSPKLSSKRKKRGLYRYLEAHGRQEVIIESPKHNEDIASMSLGQASRIIETYYSRYVELMGVNENMMCIIFKNHGMKAGASLYHPHSQLAITSVAPQQARMREYEAQRYFDRMGICVYCRILEEELRAGERIIFENKHFAAFVPYFASAPYEVWIMPKKHNADFGAANEAELESLAGALSQILKKYETALGGPDYNYVINSAAQYKQGEPQLHWYLQIKPRTSVAAGFEIGAGIPINPSVPENDAKELAVLTPETD